MHGEQGPGAAAVTGEPNEIAATLGGFAESGISHIQLVLIVPHQGGGIRQAGMGPS